MNDKFKDFPLCINCKYFMEDKTGPLQVVRNCGLTMIDPVTGELVPRRHRQAAAYRKENNPCGPAGAFFKPKEGKKTQPKKKEIIKEAPKESQAKVIKVDFDFNAEDIKDDVPEMNADVEAGVQVNFGAHDKEQELLPKEPVKRRKRK